MDLYSTSTNGQISQRTVVSQVMIRLKNAIASGEYRPGDRLPTEQALARTYGVGRSSIREAIKVFQHLGVVESHAAKGTFLRERANISSEAITWALILGEDDLRDVVELREVIEGLCFQKLSEAVAAADPAAIDVVHALEEQVSVMDTASSEHDIDHLVEADYRFHGLIVGAGHNELFRAIYSSLHAFMSKEIDATYRLLSELEEVARDHEEIVDALRVGPANRAFERHQQHFGRTRRLLGLSDQQLLDSNR